MSEEKAKEIAAAISELIDQKINNLKGDLRHASDESGCWYSSEEKEITQLVKVLMDK